MTGILVIGATSAIAQACVDEWILRDPHSRFFLVARNPQRLKQLADDASVRTSQPSGFFELDVNDLDKHPAMITAALQHLGTLDRILIAPGTLPDQAIMEQDARQAVREFNSNATSLIGLMTLLANVLEVQKSGKMAVISSVAGDRGRASNYLYGAAKAALSTFCSGLNVRLSRSGAHLMTVKPGFVATPMTAGLPLPEKLVASPQRVAQGIVTGLEKDRNVLYVPGFWWLIMWIIRTIPTVIFKRLSL